MLLLLAGIQEYRSSSDNLIDGCLDLQPSFFSGCIRANLVAEDDDIAILVVELGGERDVIRSQDFGLEADASLYAFLGQLLNLLRSFDGDLLPPAVWSEELDEFH